MGRSMRRFKKGKSKVRVGLLSRRVPKPQAVRLPSSEETLEWNKRASVVQNYKTLGLSVDPNKRSRDGERKCIELVPVPEDDGPSDHEGDPEELKIACGRKRKGEKPAWLVPLTTMQRTYIEVLVKAYGDDLKAMARDIKLNKMQHSVSVLDQLCQRYHAFSAGKRPLLL